MYARSKLIAKFVAGFDQLNNGSVLGDLLITSQRLEEYNGQAFNKRLRRFLNRSVQRNFTSGLSIVTRSSANRLHCHCVVTVPVAAPNFDWVSFEESERYYKLYVQFKDRADLGFYKYYSRKYRQSMPKDWQRLARQVAASAKHYGLGHARLAPVRKNMDALKWYLVSNVPYKRDARDKGLHYYSSWNIRTIQNFQVVNKHTRDFRRRLAIFAQSLQLTSENYNIVLRNALGSRWFCQCEEFIKNADLLSPVQQARLRMLKQTIETYHLRSS